MSGAVMWSSGCVNVLSREHPSELLYVADEAFHHPLVQELAGLADGFTLLPGQAGGLALDFIRANLFDRTAMRPVPATAPGARQRPARQRVHDIHMNQGNSQEFR